MSSRRSVKEMMSEALREAAVLTWVFVSIDSMFQPPPFPAMWVSGNAALLAGIVFMIGLWFERSRRS
jgi:hypothetical protein